MKTLQNSTPVIGNMKNASKDFSIKVSPLAFQVLSSGIYEHKIRAFVREITCNALDANREAGHGHVPIEVTLPTEACPEFVVKDCGNGMDIDTVFELYSSYFSSTKSDSNDSIGGFGVGSKSPFCYTNSFTLLSTHEGVTSYYLIYLGENGKPQINKIFSDDTGNTSGCVVSVPVEERDFKKVTEECNNIFSWFEVYPTINGIVKEGSGKHYVESHNILPSNISNGSPSKYIEFAVGDVAYPTSISSFPEDTQDKVKFLTCYIKNPIIRMPIGSISISVSRESLSLDEKTLKKLSKRVTKLYDNLIQEIQKEIDLCDNLKDIPVKLQECFSVVEKNTNIFTFKGNPLDQLISSPEIKVDVHSDKYFYRKKPYWYRKSLSNLLKSVNQFTITPVILLHKDSKNTKGIRLLRESFLLKAYCIVYIDSDKKLQEYKSMLNDYNYKVISLKEFQDKNKAQIVSSTSKAKSSPQKVLCYINDAYSRSEFDSIDALISYLDNNKVVVISKDYSFTSYYIKSTFDYIRGITNEDVVILKLTNNSVLDKFMKKYKNVVCTVTDKNSLYMYLNKTLAKFNITLADIGTHKRNALFIKSHQKLLDFIGENEFTTGLNQTLHLINRLPKRIFDLDEDLLEVSDSDVVMFKDYFSKTYPLVDLDKASSLIKNKDTSSQLYLDLVEYMNSKLQKEELKNAA